MSRRERRRISQRDAKITDGGANITLLPLDEGEIVSSLGVRGTQCDRAAKHDARTVHLFGPPQRRPEVVLRVEEGRANRDRLLELGDRFVRASLSAEDESEPVVRLGQLRRVCERRAVVGGRGVEVALAFVYEAEQIMRAARLRPDRQHLVRNRRGVVQTVRGNGDAAQSDPAKAAQAILEIASAKEPPLRGAFFCASR